MVDKGCLFGSENAKIELRMDVCALYYQMELLENRT